MVIIPNDPNIPVAFAGAFGTLLLTLFSRPLNTETVKLISAVIGAFVTFVILALAFPADVRLTIIDALFIGFGVPIGTTVAIASQGPIKKLLVIQAVRWARREHK